MRLVGLLLMTTKYIKVTILDSRKRQLTFYVIGDLVKLK